MQLAGEIAQPVALLGPDEADAADRGRRRRRDGDGGDRRHEVGHVGHVDVDAGERSCRVARHGGAGAVVGDVAAHRPSRSTKATSPCSDVAVQARHAH